MSRPPRRGPAASDRGRRGPFGALLRAVSTDGSAAGGLAAAYACMEPEGRRRLVDTVVADAAAEGVASGPALATLLSAERDPAVARHIFAAMGEAGQMQPVGPPTAMSTGDSKRGAAVVIRPLFGELVELVASSWTAEGVGEVRHEPLVGPAALDHALGRVEDAAALRPCSIDHALGLLAQVLWRHRRRHGSLPAGADRLGSFL